MLIVLIFVGTAVLSVTDPSAISTLFFFVFSIVGIAVLIKVLLDFALHFKKEDEDEETDKLLKEPEGKTFLDITDYSEALKKRYKSD